MNNITTLSTIRENRIIEDKDANRWDEIDDDQIEIDPYVSNPTRRRDDELNRVLAILDEIESGGKPS